MFTAVKPLTLWSSWQSLAFRLWDEEEKKLVSYGYIRGRERKSSMTPSVPRHEAVDRGRQTGAAIAGGRTEP